MDTIKQEKRKSGYTKTNIIKENIIAIFVAYPGSLGSDGIIECVLENGKTHLYNITNEDNYEINNKGYEKLYLGGCGNYLYIREEYALMFYRLAYAKTYSQVYEKWREYIQYILDTKEF